jgi:hypothetical protein
MFGAVSALVLLVVLVEFYASTDIGDSTITPTIATASTATTAGTTTFLFRLFWSVIMQLSLILNYNH